MRTLRTLLLLLAYYLVVTPAGLLSRLVDDPLARRWNRRADTYWNAPPPSTGSLSAATRACNRPNGDRR
ncbi:hypothetical protein DDE05_45440 [Streptomyces cavourensis]|nr:hypothetical protein DDE05_45440 [Streptomyces cavourensis]